MQFHGLLQGTVTICYNGGWVWGGNGKGGIKYYGEYSLRHEIKYRWII